MNFIVNFTFDAAADLKEIYKYILFNDTPLVLVNVIVKITLVLVPEAITVFLSLSNNLSNPVVDSQKFGLVFI